MAQLGWVVSAEFQSGSFWPVLRSELFRPDLFILGKQVRYYVQLMIKVTKVMYLIVLNAVKEFFSFQKIPPFNNFVNFNTSKLINKQCSLYSLKLGT